MESKQHKHQQYIPTDLPANWLVPLLFFGTPVRLEEKPEGSGVVWFGDLVFDDFVGLGHHTVDGRNPKQPPWDGAETLSIVG